jgi:endonuclease/exonuclease/phosphatase family metal-dependent hydrolase
MKIISLNTYMGHVFEPLMNFFEEQGGDTDVFCLQEMISSEDPDLVHTEGTRRLNVLQEIQKRLPDHNMFFEGTQEDFEIDAPYAGQSLLGNAIFYKKDLKVLETGSFMICNAFNSFVPPDYATLGHNAVFLVTEIDGQPHLICNIHGSSQPADKLDAPERIAQFEKVRDFLATRSEQIVLMGDFNTFPDTKSVKMFEDLGLKNLITEYDIQTTRGSHMRVLFPQYEHGTYGFQEFADYTFLSKDVNVESFEVPDLPISDHLPMILKITHP